MTNQQQPQQPDQTQPAQLEPITPIVPVVIIQTFGAYQNACIVKDWRIALQVLIDVQADSHARPDRIFVHIATEL